MATAACHKNSAQYWTTSLMEGRLQPATRPQDSAGHFTCSCLLREVACRPLSVALGIRLLANSSWKSGPLTAASAGPLLPAATRGRSGTMAEADITSLESAARAPPPPSASPSAGQWGKDSAQEYVMRGMAHSLCHKSLAYAPAMAIGDSIAAADWHGASSKLP